MKKGILLILLFSSLGSFAQNVTKDDLNKEIVALTAKYNALSAVNGKLKAAIGALDSSISNANRSIDSLRTQTQVNSQAISESSKTLGLQITTTETNTNQKISDVGELLSKNSLYGIIGVLSAILLSGLMYWLISKKQRTDKTDLIDQLSKTKGSIEESLVKEFGKQTELMESQLHLIEQQKSLAQVFPNAEPDHTFPLKVADEVTLIERNINLMDSGTKGLKQLVRSVEKIKDNLFTNGYEIPVLLGKPFNQGMKIVPISTIPDENLAPGIEMITKIIRPQVNYNDKMIQAAQVEVSVGY